MISSPTFQTFFQGLQGVLNTRLTVLRIRDAQINPATTALPLLINHIVGAAPDENARRWIVGARVILEQTLDKHAATPPPFIIHALEVWNQALPFEQKCPHFDGVNLYFQQALAASLGREGPPPVTESASSKPPPRRISSASRLAAVSPPIPLRTRFEWGPLPDKGLSILTRVEKLEFERMEILIDGLRRFLEAEPVPMAVVDMSDDIGNMVLVNESFRRKFEWTDEGIKNASLRKLFHIGDAFSLAARIFLIRRKDKAHFKPTSIRFGRGNGGYWRATGAGIVRLWHGSFYGVGTLTDLKEA